MSFPRLYHIDLLTGSFGEWPFPDDMTGCFIWLFPDISPNVLNVTYLHKYSQTGYDLHRYNNFTQPYR